VQNLTGTLRVTTGYYHTCAILQGGSVKCWGYNGYGELGDNSNIDSYSPKKVLGLVAPVTHLTSGYEFTCALLSTEKVQCWGFDDYGNWPGSKNGTKLTAYTIPGLSGVVSVSAGGYTMCVVLNTGIVKCLGGNDDGQFGTGYTGLRTNNPVQVFEVVGAIEVSVGDYYVACALLNTGRVKCWGYNYYGMLGSGGEDTYRLIPQFDAISIGVGYFFSCALLSVGEVKCWGDNTYGELGNPVGTTISLTPVTVTGLSSGVVSLQVASYGGCAVLKNSTIVCWGFGLEGEVGNGDYIYSNYIPGFVIGYGA